MSLRLFRLLLVVAALALLYGSLHPLEFLPARRWPGLYYRPPYGRSGYLDVVLNVLAYVPLGMLAAASFRKWPARLATGFAISAMSLGIEYAQLWIRTRDGNLSDFYANALGAFIGVLGGGWFLKRLHLESIGKIWRRDRAAWLLMLAWIFWQTFPFVPSIRFAKLTAFLNIWSAPRFNFLEIGDSLLVGMTLAFLVGSAKAPWPWLGLTGTLLLRGIIIGHSLPLPVFILTIAGFAATRRVQPSAGLAAPLMVAWVLLRELSPFSFSTIATPFQFSFVLETDRIPVIRSLLGKFFLYTSTLWLLKEAGWRLSLATALLSTILLGCEFIQRYLPGRTPEFTDVLVTIAGAVMLALAAKRRG